MTGFILVHGSCYGAWSWRDASLAPTVDRIARAIDLAGHGANPSPRTDVNERPAPDFLFFLGSRGLPLLPTGIAGLF